MYRFVLPHGTYETVITNLSVADFPPDELKSLFRMRWGIRPGQTTTRKIRFVCWTQFFWIAQKNGSGLFPHAISDFSFIPCLLFELNLMTLCNSPPSIQYRKYVC